MKKTVFVMLFTISFVQIFAQHVLKGKVSGEDGEALVGVNVYERGTINGSVSDYNGLYTVTFSNENSVIAFSYIGYATQFITAGKQTSADIKLIRNASLMSVEIVGSRKLNRSATESTVPVDIFEIPKLTNSIGQPGLNQILQMVAPSFNANKQSGSDGADHLDPATLRGLGPDQTLVLVNGKRRHQSSLINVFGTRGRGNTGTDLNAIPASAIDHIEILRDGASAQYGSDAIAGVINVVLKSGSGEMSGNLGYGMYNAKPAPGLGVLKNDKSYDGETSLANANYGIALGNNGFFNMTFDYMKQDHTNRAPDPNKFDVYRNQFGDAASENFASYFNSSISIGKNAQFYMFGGFNHRFTDSYAWTRASHESRNIPEIYPNGFDPKIQSLINDQSVSIGFKSDVNGWTMDINNTIGSNRFHYYVDNTLNATLLAASPTRFDAGGFSAMQNTTTIDLSRLFPSVMKGLNLAFGLEHRIDNYSIFAGEEGSYKTYGTQWFVDTTFQDGNMVIDSTLRPGGSQGFPGFQPSNELSESRTNLGIYADAELDMSKALTVGAAARVERYSDFGNATNGKLALRYKIAPWISFRASASTGFRAPSLTQLYYNTIYTDFVAGKAVDKIIAKNNSPITRALGIPKLKEEKSVNLGAGITAKYKSLTLTLDAYHVSINDRIVLTGSFSSDDPDIGASLQALNVSAAQCFTNAVNTSTTGLDAILTWSTVFENKHILRVSFGSNFNDMKIDKIYTNDKLKGKESTYFGLREQYFLLASAPKSKVSIGVEYLINNFSANLRFTNYGDVKLVNWNDNGDNIIDPGELDTYKAKMSTDLSVSYKIKNISFTIGGNNILNAYPDVHDPALTESGGIWDAVQMGFSGAYYYTRLGFRF
ncbi:MAG: TonB-dependent receptor [Bacteroidota bacterium]